MLFNICNLKIRVPKAQNLNFRDYFLWSLAVFLDRSWVSIKIIRLFGLLPQAFLLNDTIENTKNQLTIITVCICLVDFNLSTVSDQYLPILDGHVWYRKFLYFFGSYQNNGNLLNK